VLAAIEKSVITPTQCTQFEVHKRTCTIGLIVPDTPTPFVAEIAGVEETPVRRRLHVILCNS
jgi:DNA-binding LacI/PurR family transcriptional regulator